MKCQVLIVCVLIFLCLGAGIPARAQCVFDPVEYVNPLMGTQSTYELSTGNTYPAIARPWGMNFWMPQTGKMGDGWAYVYTANKIRGFKQTHQPSPWINDYGQFSLMPVVGTPEFDQDKRASWFSHKGEVAKPYYYKVYLAEHDVVTEFTTTDRAALFRFTFPENERSYVVVDAFDRGSFVKIVGNNRIEGYTTRNSGGVPGNFKNYFVIEFDKSFEYRHTFADGKLSDELYQQANHTGSVIGFRTEKGEKVHARVASSFISLEQAERNLKELGDDDFDALVEKGKTEWNEVLGAIQVEGGSLDQYRVFYSCLYRSVLFPRKFYEFDAAGNIVHYSPYNGNVLSGYMYTDTGFWDTFRCLFPLLNLVYPSRNREIQEGLINTYKESGFFPEWASPGHRGCMVGNNSASVLADAYLKGVRVADVEALYAGLVHGTEHVHPKASSTGRLGNEYYNKLGYVPYNVGINESAARTLEYAYDDWTIYHTALLAGNRSVADTYKKRAANYTNVFDTNMGYARPRYADGRWKENFNLLNTHGEGFIEGNALNYSFYVPQDVDNMIRLMGGDKSFVSKLDSLFTMHLPAEFFAQTEDVTEEGLLGGYVHGNEPSHHIPFLYAWTSQPWKTQYWQREIMNKMYRNNIDGLCGNDDCGQMSAWYILSSMGFYPVCPGTDQYILGSPLFKNVTLNLENGKKVVIKANNNGEANRYISSMKVNGKNYTKNYLTHGDLMRGMNILYNMSATPNKSRGTQDSDVPYSFSNELGK